MADVVFRRIHGRIVPIKMGRSTQKAIHEQRKEDAKGAAAIVSGVAVGHYAGKKAAKAVFRAATMENHAHDILKKVHPNAHGQHSLFNAPRTAAAGEAISHSTRLFRSRNIWLGAGNAVAGALIGYGVNKLTEKQGRKEKAKKVNSALATAGGAAAGFALKNRIATIVYRHEINPSESLRKAFEYAAKRK